jgi:two-component system, NarL family, sensor histidine kinase UhpB
LLRQVGFDDGTLRGLWRTSPILARLLSAIAGASAAGTDSCKEEKLPLRARLMALVCAILLISLAGGGTLIAWHAAGRVQTELRAALTVGANALENGLKELRTADDRSGELRRLIATFDGNRHVRATLFDERQASTTSSRLPAPGRKVPGWFARLIGNPIAPLRIPVGSHAAVVLDPDPANELDEVWEESRDTMLVLAGFASLSALLISVVVGRALRSLEALSTAFATVGNGDCHNPVAPQGAPELKRLALAFNQMTERLGTAAAQNKRLNERLLSLQAEERAELARNLHDDIGPLLFAVEMTVATMERVAAAGHVGDIPAHSRAIHDAVALMQRHVRDILGRLRPISATGLQNAVERLVSFWQRRRPDIGFNLTIAIEEDLLEEDAQKTIYRVVQEGLSNAIRHAAPGRIDITIMHDNADGVRVELTDDGVGLTPEHAKSRGPERLGLIGMRERVMAMAGSLSVMPGRDAKGLTLTASLPCTNRVPEEREAIG